MKYLSLLFLVVLVTNVQALEPPTATTPEKKVWDQWVQKASRTSGYLNGLILSESPYLLQHANNPIDWTSLPIPKQSEKLLFISIGYASCHWCHQMNEHTFMNSKVAEVLNENFISVKVDRDEHPEFDYRYLQIQQAVLGEGGWPISIIALPDGSPAWVGSFADSEEMIRIATRMSRVWSIQPDLIRSQAKNIATISSSSLQANREGSYRDYLLQNRDLTNFGKKGKVKFPDEGDLFYMLSMVRSGQDEKLKAALVNHLDALAQSPLFDGVNGGFYRYATKGDWTVPHFEKMLYTQAQLLAIYSKAYALFKKPVYKSVAIRIYNFLQRHMKRKDGLYMTSINADWQGIEGGYYLWEKKQLDDAQVTAHISQVGDKWQYHGVEENQVLISLQSQRSEILKDKRGLTGLNGLVLWALSEANNIEILGAKEAMLDLANLLSSNGLIHESKVKRVCYKDSECLPGNIDDYAYLALGFSSVSGYGFSYEKVATSLLNSSIDRISFDDKFAVEDHESISPIASVVIAASNLGMPLSYDWLSLTEAKASASYLGAKTDYISRYYVAHFAKGNAIVLSITDDRGSNIVLIMKDGWHVNSNEPIQDYLIPTHVSLEDESRVSYPKGSLMKMGFSDERLSLYEDTVSIHIASNVTEILLSLQACNDRLCLPPEKIIIK